MTGLNNLCYTHTSDNAMKLLVSMEVTTFKWHANAGVDDKRDYPSCILTPVMFTYLGTCVSNNVIEIQQYITSWLATYAHAHRLTHAHTHRHKHITIYVAILW